eukprot:725193-Pyramimonas_sp.AAC.1
MSATNAARGDRGEGKLRMRWLLFSKSRHYVRQLWHDSTHVNHNNNEHEEIYPALAGGWSVSCPTLSSWAPCVSL